MSYNNKFNLENRYPADTYQWFIQNNSGSLYDGQGNSIDNISASNIICTNFTSSQTPVTAAYVSSSTFLQIQIGGVTRYVPLFQ